MSSSIPASITSLSTIFTPPAECTTRWTYEGSAYNQISNGLLLQNAVAVDWTCFPGGFSNTGRVAYGSAYSPDWCPYGYTSPQVDIVGTATTAVCCISDFTYYTTPTTVGDLISTNVVFAGCLSMYPASDGSTSVPCRNDTAKTCNTVVSGPITMWAQPITVAFNKEQASAYNSITASPSSTSASSLSTQSPAAAAAAYSTIAQSTSTSTTTPLQDESKNTGLSTGAKIGIGIGIAVAVLLLLNFTALFWYRRYRKAKAAHGKEDISYLRQYRQPGVVELHSAHRPPEMDAPNRCEMAAPAGMTYRDRVELYG
ncbi:hypothetical protein BO70DRAFT_332532 [Aspergillus heteromorphus CBS 117.55]|uniref:Mid2 domain-containing protein n=1 Tax=Aspergillus heteromorphus CBS 117.55 TaxID=1448321 RepID=A0A317WPG5_9EURO|nr:uncharacterized protein BO70DRAFT_332532 [Aspergillus heteromorphus CBS 117.55]PWY87551.1 hypothetical protein BO70DRAFT_332532 [Aspergillus heteromorphus CBS 117.55]